MDCIEAKEKIDLYIDGMLSETEMQRLIWHTTSCAECRKALDDAIALKKALGSMGEVEPPAGLAVVAIKKAKKRRIPIYAYATAAAAAVIALAFAFSPHGLRGSDLDAAKNEDGQLMYSAAGESAAAGGGGQNRDEDVNAGEAIEGSISGPQLANSFGTGPSTDTQIESEAITEKSPVSYTFASEAEFTAALQTKRDGASTVESYYRPTALPEDAALQQITVNDDVLRWSYSLPYGSPLAFEWLRTITWDDLQEWSDSTLLSDGTFNISGGVLWSSQVRIMPDGQVLTDNTVINAYWMQDGAIFHMELPAFYTEENIVKSCAAEAVPVQ